MASPSSLFGSFCSLFGFFLPTFAFCFHSFFPFPRMRRFLIFICVWAALPSSLCSCFSFSCLPLLLFLFLFPLSRTRKLSDFCLCLGSSLIMLGRRRRRNNEHAVSPVISLLLFPLFLFFSSFGSLRPSCLFPSPRTRNYLIFVCVWAPLWSFLRLATCLSCATEERKRRIVV